MKDENELVEVSPDNALVQIRKTSEVLTWEDAKDQ
jgi:hypothetical protein